jgi:hypothetical protein
MPYHGLVINGRLPVPAGATVISKDGAFRLPCGKPVLEDGAGGFYHPISQNARPRPLWNGNTEGYVGGVGIRFIGYATNSQPVHERCSSFAVAGRLAQIPNRNAQQVGWDNSNGWTWRDYQLLTGAGRDLLGRQLNGWVFSDTHGINWLMSTSNLEAVENTLSANSASFTIPITRFGELREQAIASSNALSISIADLGQSTPSLTVGNKNIFPSGGGAAVEPDGASAYRNRFYICDTTLHGDKVLLGYGQHWIEASSGVSQTLCCSPRILAFVELSVTSGGTPGAPPTVTASLLKTRAQCVGTWSSSGTGMTWTNVGGEYFALIGTQSQQFNLSGLHLWAYYNNLGSAVYLTAERTLTGSLTRSGSVSTTANGKTLTGGSFAESGSVDQVYTITHPGGGQLQGRYQSTINVTYGWDNTNLEFDSSTSFTESIQRTGITTTSNSSSSSRQGAPTPWLTSLEAGGGPGPGPVTVPDELLSIVDRLSSKVLDDPDIGTVWLAGQHAYLMATLTPGASGGFTPATLGSLAHPGGLIANASGVFYAQNRKSGEASNGTNVRYYI